MTARVGGNVYDFAQLSPLDFEELTRDLLQKDWNVRLESFKTGRDQGIDLRYAASENRQIIVQCKHYAGSTVAALLRTLRESELPKIKRLAPSRYVLVTSLPLSPANKKSITEAVSPFIQSPKDIISVNDLNNLIGMFPEVEQKHFKLWLSSTEVLNRVLHNAECVQTDFNVAKIRKNIPLYVQTPNYDRALRVLDEYGFVIISGVPGIGKTTLAEMLLFAHLERGFQPVVVKSDVREAKTLFSSEKRQVFYYDDFLGDTFLGSRSEFLGKKEDSVLLEFMQMIEASKHGRLILTAREHILQYAFQISEHFQRHFGMLTAHRYILDIQKYSLIDRGRILYNHIYFSDVPLEYKNALIEDRFYIKILKHRNFNPRLVEWLSKYTNVRQTPVAAYRDEVLRVLNNPEQLWAIAFEQQISEGARSALLVLYSLGGEASLSALHEGWKALHHKRAVRHNWKTRPEDWRQSLRELENSFLEYNDKSVSFVNPSVKDFLNSKLINDPEYVEDIVLGATTFEQIVTVWALATSERGETLRAELLRSGSALIVALNTTLPSPEYVRIDTAEGVRLQRSDVSPEIRLRTLVSMYADGSLVGAWALAITYSDEVLASWVNRSPDYATVIPIIKMLDRISSPDAIQVSHALRAGLLRRLSDETSESFATFVAFAQEQADAGWWTEKASDVRAAFLHYLDQDFHDELANCTSDGECSALSKALITTGRFCDVDVSTYDSEIDEFMERMHEAQDDERDEMWQEKPVQPEYLNEEAEVNRMFDGFQFTPSS